MFKPFLAFPLIYSSKLIPLIGWLLTLYCLCVSSSVIARPELGAVFQSHINNFNFATGSAIGDLVVDDADDELVRIASRLVRDDFSLVTDQTPGLLNRLDDSPLPKILVGALGKSPMLDQLIAQQHLNIAKLNNCFECYQFHFSEHQKAPLLMIIGADRRGAAYGLIEISRALKVSPWVWWGDVLPDKQQGFSLPKKDLFFSSPSVKYRGIYINDEDFGLLPWVVHNFEKSPDGSPGNIGPKTYQKIFELMLRLRANTLWPAMHKVSTSFNLNPENARLANQYGIVMGASHAEPMLRNNVGEWRAPPEDYDFSRNRTGVLQYWRERLQTNGGYDNIYTLGMRGIHDSRMQGADTPEEKQRLLNDVLVSQEQLLDEVLGESHSAPRIFVPYKEVLETYEQGIKLKDDVTIVWPDDNFGYIRRFADAQERGRAGGAGIYYHLSYLGAPLSYLWLATTPPDLLRLELTRAYESGARQFWMFNVGDIKPAEINISQALEMAWDMPAVGQLSQYEYLQRFFSHNLDEKSSAVLAGLMDDYFKLNYARKPEHLQYHLPKEPYKLSGKSSAELLALAEQAQALIARLQAFDQSAVPPQRRDALFELVRYSLEASAQAHARFAWLELYFKHYEATPVVGQYFGNQAILADRRIKELTNQYHHIQQGKWQYLINEEPADNLWRSYRISKPLLPLFVENLPVPEFRFDLLSKDKVYQAENYHNKQWQVYDGLSAVKALVDGAEIKIPVSLPVKGEYCIRVDIIPIFPRDANKPWVLNLNLQGQRHMLEYRQSYDDKNWAQGVLNHYISRSVAFSGGPGKIQLYMKANAADLLIDKVVVSPRKNQSCE